jgi:hypothetical protein
VDPELADLVAASGDHSPVARQGADDHRLADQARIEQPLDRDEEGVEVEAADPSSDLVWLASQLHSGLPNTCTVKRAGGQVGGSQPVFCEKKKSSATERVSPDTAIGFWSLFSALIPKPCFA